MVMTLQQAYDLVLPGRPAPDIDPVMYMAESYAHSECSGCGQHAGELFPGWEYAAVDE